MDPITKPGTKHSCKFAWVLELLDGLVGIKLLRAPAAATRVGVAQAAAAPLERSAESSGLLCPFGRGRSGYVLRSKRATVAALPRAAAELTRAFWLQEYCAP